MEWPNSPPGFWLHGTGASAIGLVSVDQKNSSTEKLTKEEGTHKGLDDEMMVEFKTYIGSEQSPLSSFMFPLEHERQKILEKEKMEAQRRSKETRDQELVEEAGLEIRKREMGIPLSASNWHVKSESPNSLKSLFGPSISLACNFIPSRMPKRKSTVYYHSQEWNDNTNIPTTLEREERITLIPRSKQRRKKYSLVPTGKKTLPSLSGAKKKTVNREEEQPNKKKRKEEDAVDCDSAQTYLKRTITLEITKCILIREELVRYVRKLCKAKTIEIQEFATSLKELKKVSLQLVENLVRWKRQSTGHHGSKTMNKNFNNNNDNNCSKQHTMTWSHEYGGINYEWEGTNYVLKMCHDLNFANQTLQENLEKFDWGVQSLDRNPLILDHTLDELAEEIRKLECPENELWKLFSKDDDLRGYHAAMVILREEKLFGHGHVKLDHLQEGADERLSESCGNLVLESDKRDKILQCCIEIEKERRKTKGCWNPVENRFEAIPPTPFILKQAKLGCKKRLAEIEKELERKRHLQQLYVQKCTVRIQAFIRAYQGRVFVQNHRNMIQVAVRFQAVVRGAVVRMKHGSLLEQFRERRREQHLHDWFLLAEKSALAIQCFMRGLWATGFVQNVRENTAARRIQLWLRQQRRKHFYFMNLMARKVQTLLRQSKAKQFAKLLRMDKEQRVAAFKIQIAFRKVRAERAVVEAKRSDAAKLVQHRVRGFLSRRLFQKIMVAKKVQTIWRRVLAKREVDSKRKLVNAIKKVQRWQRINMFVRDNLIETRVRKWRHGHITSKRKFWSKIGELRRGESEIYFHLCALYDHEIKLRRWKDTLGNTRAAKEVLEGLQLRMARENSLHGRPSFRRAPFLAMHKVRQRYEKKIRFTKHFSEDELNAHLKDAERDLDQIKEKIEVVETLVRNQFDREDFSKKAVHAFGNVGHAIRAKNVVSFEQFESEYGKAKRQDRIVNDLQKAAMIASRRTKTALRMAEWSHRAQLVNMDKSQELLEANTRRRDIDAAKTQINRFLFGKGCKRALERRSRRQMEEEFARRLQREWNNMEGEDNYARIHRPYLAAESQAIERLYPRFSPFHHSHITLSQFQQVAYALGFTVAKKYLRTYMQLVDVDNRGRISFQEFALWYFCKRKEDQIKLRSIGDVCHAIGLTTMLQFKRTFRCINS